MEKCNVCDKNLATCETVWAVEGKLVCSSECGIKALSEEYGSFAANVFKDTAEEVAPRDIGISTLIDYIMSNWECSYEEADIIAGEVRISVDRIIQEFIEADDLEV